MTRRERPDESSLPNERCVDTAPTAEEGSSSPLSPSTSSFSSGGWKFHPLPTRRRSVREDDGDGIVGRSRNGHDEDCGIEEDRLRDGGTAARYDDDDAPLIELVDEFDNDGFLCLSDVLKPRMAKGEGEEKYDVYNDVVGSLRDLVVRHVSDVFRTLHKNGHSAFELSHRRRRVVGVEGAGASAEAGMSDDGPATGVEGDGDGDGEGECPVTVSGCGRYEYPMKCGVRNGFREVVMRSPGRYELALLNNNDSSRGSGGGDVGYGDGRGCVGDGEETPTSASAVTVPILDLVKRHILSNDSLLRLVRSLLVRNGPPDKRDRLCEVGGLRDLNGREDRGAEEEDDEGYRLLSVSIVVSAPGADDQGWHADGGHVNPTEHEMCHCLNVFLPLVDAEDEAELRMLGPTELRPGTHYHTRNLAPMMLAARARRTLRPPVLPLVRAGDALVFDYRVLHRGRANLTGDDGFDGGVDEGESEGDGRGDGDGEVGVDRGGRCRPVLVLTFAQSWFRDVLNFPRRSLHLVHDSPP